MRYIILTLLFFGLAKSTIINSDKFSEWKVTGGTKENTHFSSLRQIDTSNVMHLRLAWTYHSKDADTVHHSQIQCNPIIIDNAIYATSPQLKVLALDNATGKEKWTFDPFGSSSTEDIQSVISLNNNRGVTYWKKRKDARIFFTAGSFLFALNANTGLPISSFGQNGKIDLRNGLGRDVLTTYVVSTSPGIIFKDLLILGTRVSESIGAAPGHIRAYDVRTGKQRWIFHTIPQPGEFGYKTWEDSTVYRSAGGANAWAGFSLDESRGIVFASTGSATFDFYGGKRKGANLFANCILALNAGTGKYIWHYQTIHHDVWDRDLPAAPCLITISHQGRKKEALAQITKTGFVFLLDRDNGTPLFPIEEKTTPQETELVNEKLWPTQPAPTFPKPFIRQSFTLSDLNTQLPDSSFQNLKENFLSFKSGHLFTPPSEEGTIIFPGLEGGANWGGAAFDPESNLLFVNANEVPWVVTIKRSYGPQKTESFLTAGQRLYSQFCASCHGVDKNGSGDNPTLFGIERKYTASTLRSLMTSGRRMMPSFQTLNDQETNAIVSYLLNLKEEQKNTFINSPMDINPNIFPYWHEQKKFLTPQGYPAIRPPWGTLNAVNLSTGEIQWKIPLGEYPELKNQGIITGTENFGGPVVTAGGLVFIAASKDGKLRAFSKKTGKLLWEVDLPAPAFATPSIYMAEGRQFIVIACGGGKLGTPSSDAYVAFALP